MEALNKIFENLTEKTKLHQRRKKYIKSNFNTNSLFESNDEIYMDENGGPITEETISVYKADCGHYIGFNGPQELSAQCSKCGKQLCFRCSLLRCERCLEVICTSCSDLVSNSVYCKKCRIIKFFKSLSISSLKSLHKFLSREIS